MSKLSVEEKQELINWSSKLHSLSSYLDKLEDRGRKTPELTELQLGLDVLRNTLRVYLASENVY